METLRKEAQELGSAAMRNLRKARKLEDVDYWRKRAGWYDDDTSMVQFNNGVYDTYYQLDDDAARTRTYNPEGGGDSGTAGSVGTGNDGGGFGGMFVKIAAVVLAVAIVGLIFRAVHRKTVSAAPKLPRRDRENTSRRSRSKSAGGSRSRSRSRKVTKDYELMEDEGRSRRSTKSGRSRSRSRRSRSRGSSRTRPKRESQEILV